MHKPLYSKHYYQICVDTGFMRLNGGFNIYLENKKYAFGKLFVKRHLYILKVKGEL